MPDEMVIATARALRRDRVHGAKELALWAVESAADLLAAHPERDGRQVADGEQLTQVTKIHIPKNILHHGTQYYSVQH